MVHTPTQTIALIRRRGSEHTIQSRLREDLGIAVKTVDSRAHTYKVIGRCDQTTARIQTTHILTISVVTARSIEYALLRLAISLGIRTYLNRIATCLLGNLLLHIILVLHTGDLLDHTTQNTVTQVRVVVGRTRLVAKSITLQSVLDGLIRGHTIGSRREHRIVGISVVVPTILVLQQVANRNLLITSLNLGEVLSQNTTLSERFVGQRELTLVNQALNSHRAEGLRHTCQTQHMTTIHTLTVLLIGITITTRVNQLTLIGNRYRHTRQVVVAHKGQHLLIECINTIANIDIEEFLLAILSRYGYVEQFRGVDLRFARDYLVGGCTKRNLSTLRHLEVEYHLANLVAYGNDQVVGVEQQETGTYRLQTCILGGYQRHRGDLLTRLGGWGRFGSRFVVARYQHARCQHNS